MDDEGKSRVTKEEDVEESGVKEIKEVPEERMHTPDEPEEPKFDDAFETGESSSGPASDFKDRVEDEDEEEWTHSEMEEYEDFLKSIDDAVRKKSEAIRAKRREKGKEKPKVKRTSKEKGVDFSEPAKTCEYPAYAAVPTGNHDEELLKTEMREGNGRLYRSATRYAEADDRRDKKFGEEGKYLESDRSFRNHKTSGRISICTTKREGLRATERKLQ